MSPPAQRGNSRTKFGGSEDDMGTGKKEKKPQTCALSTGRSKREWPEPIPDTPENVLKAVLKAGSVGASPTPKK